MNIMDMLQLAATYVNRIGGSEGYGHQMRILCRRLPWRAEDLTADAIDAYLTDALKHLAPQTVANHRRMLQTLLRFAAEEGLIGRTVVRKLRRVKCSAPNPTAWSHEDIRRLLAVASETPRGTFRCPWSLLLPAWILVAYSTGLRLGDLLAIRHDSLRGDRLCITMHKTGLPHVSFLDSNALRAVALLPQHGPRIFGDLVSQVAIIRAIRRCVKRAGLTGTGKWLRRSSATYCEIGGKDASGHLGHVSPGMKRYYVDRLLLSKERNDVMVPPLHLNPRNG
jgi:integrase